MSMWKYVVGGQPLKRKETQTPEEKKIKRSRVSVKASQKIVSGRVEKG